MDTAFEDRFAGALLDPAHPVPAAIASRCGAGDAGRFAVYRNNVFAGLIRALESQFPVTRRLVGSDFFTLMARDYACVVRPHSPMMFEYGVSFPDFIADFAPARDLAYLPDLARIEYAWLRAYHAADVEPMSVADIAAIDAALLAGTRLHVHPAATLLPSAFPAGSIWMAHQTQDVAPLGKIGAETVLIIRPALDVMVHIVPETDSLFAACVFAGDSLGQAALVAARNPAFDFGSAILGLASLGVFVATSLEEGSQS